MKVGLGLYHNMLTADNFRFARQCGATHIVAHAMGYSRASSSQPTTAAAGWGTAVRRDDEWSYESLAALRAAVEAEGLALWAIENFDPTDWYDVLLDGPRRSQQMEHVKEMIRAVGKAGIPVIGYNFSIAGVWGHVVGPWARGGAPSAAFLGPDGPEETPIPTGTVWNVVYDPDAPPGYLPMVTHEQIWDRVTRFLHEVLPVAEEAGVRLAAHPDDPPMPSLRGQARLVYQPRFYRDLLAISPSPSNALEFCVGTLSEMSEGDIYQVVDEFSARRVVTYVHLRNVRGKVPHYHEVFIDEGDTDMLRVLEILKKNDFDGVIIPDHTPRVTCAAPWHAGMAYALGWIRAAIATLA